MLEESREGLLSIGAEVTVREIKQQPELWQETITIYEREREKITGFLEGIREKHGRVRVIFTGAGSSAYVGDTVLPVVKETGDEAAFDFQAVPTTTLVSNPKSFLNPEWPTVLVSFARSGNSPESIATVNLAKQLVEDLYQITITCAAEGTLARQAEGDEANLLLLMPERSNDQGFAMTGSFTCMTLMALLLFNDQPWEQKQGWVSRIIAMGQDILKREAEIQAFVDQDFERVVYLGSGPLAGIAREVQLKILELTAGRKATAFDSSLGFRHGPKSFVNEDTLVFLLVSNDDYTRQYDLDMLHELQADGIARTAAGVLVGEGEGLSGTSFILEQEHAQVPDGYLALPFALFGQIVALLTAVKVGNKPDTPSPTGTVNRVVKGVTIYDNLDIK